MKSRAEILGYHEQSPTFNAGIDRSTQFSIMPPQAVDLESAVLGAILIQPDSINKVMLTLKADHFYKPAHGIIYRAMNEMFNERKPIDLHTLMEYMKAKMTLQRAGGAAYLAELTGKVVAATNIEYHSFVILEKALKRQIIVLGHHYYEKAYRDDQDALLLLDEFDKAVVDLRRITIRSNDQSTIELYDQILNELEPFADGLLTEEPGVPWFNKKLTSRLGNLMGGDYVIIAARPAMGKTAAALEIAGDYKADEVVPFFTYEMTDKQLAARDLFRRAKVNSRIYRKKTKTDRIAFDRLAIARENTSSSGLKIVESYGWNVMQLRAKLRDIINEEAQQGRKVRKIIIDYLQLMEGTSGNSSNRERDVAEISRALKMIGVEFDIVIFALAQFSRKVEERSDKRPIASDLRESGSLEQDADFILGLYRPEHYKVLEDKNKRSLRNVMEWLPLKDRHGGQNDPIVLYIKLQWGAIYSSREEMEEDERCVKVEENEALAKIKSQSELHGGDQVMNEALLSHNEDLPF